MGVTLCDKGGDICLKYDRFPSQIPMARKNRKWGHVMEDACQSFQTVPLALPGKLLLRSLGLRGEPDSLGFDPGC